MKKTDWIKVTVIALGLMLSACGSDSDTTALAPNLNCASAYRNASGTYIYQGQPINCDSYFRDYANGGTYNNGNYGNNLGFGFGLGVGYTGGSFGNYGYSNGGGYIGSDGRYYEDNGSNGNNWECPVATVAGGSAGAIIGDAIFDSTAGAVIGGLIGGTGGYAIGCD